MRLVRRINRGYSLPARSERPPLARVVSAVTALPVLCLAMQSVAEASGIDMESFMEVRAGYDRAVEERGAAVDQALTRTMTHLESNPNDVVAVMYKGSLYAMKAGDSFFPWTKLRHLRKGTSLMDEAMDQIDKATLHPYRHAELEMLLVRSMTNARIPKAFNRGGMARQDFSRIEAHPRFSELPEDTQAEVLVWRAYFSGRDGDREAADELLARARDLDRSAADQLWSELQ